MKRPRSFGKFNISFGLACTRHKTKAVVGPVALRAARLESLRLIRSLSGGISLPGSVGASREETLAVRLSRSLSDRDKSNDHNGNEHPILNMDAEDIEPLSEQMHRPLQGFARACSLFQRGADASHGPGPSFWTFLAGGAYAIWLISPPT